MEPENTTPEATAPTPEVVDAPTESASTEPAPATMPETPAEPMATPVESTPVTPTTPVIPVAAAQPQVGENVSIMGVKSYFLFGASLIINLIAIGAFDGTTVGKVLAALAILIFIVGFVSFVKELKASQVTWVGYVMLVLGLFFGLMAGLGTFV